MGILKISAKCSDLCFVSFVSGENGGINLEHDGYVPRNIGIGGGDYIELSIDTSTGQIIGFKENITDENIINELEK